MFKSKGGSVLVFSGFPRSETVKGTMRDLGGVTRGIVRSGGSSTITRRMYELLRRLDLWTLN